MRNISLLTLGNKVAAVASLLLLAGLITIIVFQSIRSAEMVAQQKRLDYRVIAELLGGQLSGAIRWGKPAAVELAFQNLVKSSTDSALGLQAYRAGGELMSSQLNDALPESAQLSVSETIELQAETSVTVDGDLITVAQPVFSGKDAEQIGQLHITWSLASLNKSLIEQRNQLYMLGMLVVVTIAAAVVYALRAMAGRPLSEAVALADNIAQGRLNNEMKIKSRDEIGRLCAALMKMQTGLRDQREREARQAAETTRIKEALDNASSQVMLADPKHQIVYCNLAAQNMLQAHTDAFQQVLPEFSSAQVIGYDIGRLLAAGANGSLDITASQSQPIDLRIGEARFRVVASAVLSEDGNRIGTVVEWNDRTEAAAVEAEIQEIIQQASHGNLSIRADERNREGFFLLVSQSINELLNTLENIVSDVNQVLSQVAACNLNIWIDNDYQGLFGELKTSVNTTISNLANTVADIKNSASPITHSADEISAGNLSLSQRTEEQARELDQVKHTLHEFKSLVHQNAEFTRQSDEEVVTTKQAAQNGESTVVDAIAAMNQINSASNRIAEIISVIDSIAFQTNLLALNASVEAARAGDHGRGFAVVASEVRLLAQRSAGAAKEIKELIQDSVQKVGAGSALVVESGDALKEILRGMAKVDEFSKQIRSAFTDQARQIDDISAMIDSLDNATQQNAALAEEISAASLSMNENARHLLENTERFALAQS